LLAEPDDEGMHMKVVIAGGTGQTGRLVSRALRAAGHEAVPASPSTGVDAVTGAGLRDVVSGAEAVLDVTNSPSRDEQVATDFFRAGSVNLLAAGRAAGVRHHVVLSIVGVDLVERLPYYRAKVAQEQAVREGGVPFTIVRATQFFEFLPSIVDFNTEGGVARLDGTLLQPVDLTELAGILSEVVTGPAGGGVLDVAGPEVLALDEIGRRVRPGAEVESDEANRAFFGAEVPAGALIAGPGARLGRVDLAAWLAR
jgi:uncharacterized protein YbjT (DUF2867 family)